MSRPAIFALAFLVAGTATAQEAVTVEVLETEEYGAFLSVDDLPVYLLTTDTQGSPADPAGVTCLDECLDVWPPVVADGAPVAGEGVAAELLGTVEHMGRTIITYNGWPLYHFERDVPDGPPTGQEIESFGGSWLLVAPDGEPILGEGV
jgi:predicted lipoprotein with Yx(FWY)xxD motif